MKLNMKRSNSIDLLELVHEYICIESDDSGRPYKLIDGTIMANTLADKLTEDNLRSHLFRASEFFKDCIDETCERSIN